MFGLNEITGQKPFRDIVGKLMVTSIFYTLQGEGPYAGQPALFLRLSKCQLACSFCDTWFDTGTWMEFEDIRQELIECWVIGAEGTQTKLKNVVLVITGGEPMLQRCISDFIKFIDPDLPRVQIESNGLLMQDIPDHTCLVVSPKCSETDAPAKFTIKYLKPPASVLARADCLKFLFRADFFNPGSPYTSVPVWAFEWKQQTGRTIYLSPMAEYLNYPHLTTPEQELIARSKNKASFWDEGVFDKVHMRANYEGAAQYCMTHGLTLSLQQHLFVSIA